MIVKGEQVSYPETPQGDSGKLQHAQCPAGEDPQDEVERYILWDTSIPATEEAELADVLPLQRPVCPCCFLELPKSMVCGAC
jgi:hypothetical protein